MIYSKIIGTGSYLPEKFLTNQELAQSLDTSDEWIRTRTGIGGRHIAAANESSADLAFNAAQNALQMANISADSLDLIIVATSTAEHVFPSDASQLQYRLGCRLIPAFDMQAACAGFAYAFATADMFIKSGMYRRVLVVGSDMFSSILDWSDRNTAVLFGDGAGAVILEASTTAGVLGSVLYSDGKQRELLYVPCGRGTPQNLRAERSPFIQMQGREVFKVAVTQLARMVTELLEKCAMDAAELDFLIPHQANLRIIEATAKHLGMPIEKVIVTVQEHANTSAASVPLALDFGIRSGKIRSGNKLLLEAFGAGFTWGGSIVQY